MSKKNNYGVYKVTGNVFTLKKGGFSNTYECEKWIRAEVKNTKDSTDNGGNFAIMSLRKKFTLQTKTTVSVKLVDYIAKPDAQNPPSKVVE